MAGRAYPASKSRIGVVESVYCQQPGDNPISAESRFSRWLNTDEQPYSRKIKVTEEWQPLDWGWLKKASMLVVVNEEGRFLQVQPTPQERCDAISKVVEIGIAVCLDGGTLNIPFAEILPRESSRFSPCKSIEAGLVLCCRHGEASLVLRCRHGEARCSIMLFPD
jgi:hypothetical protein